MLLLDAFFRFSGIGLLLLTSVVAIRDLPKSTSLTLLLLVNFSIISHYLGFAHPAFQLPLSITLVLRFIDVFLLGLLWLFVLSLFQQTFKLKVFHLAVFAAMAGSSMAERLVQYGYLSQLPVWWAHWVNGLAFFIVIHMVTVTLMGSSDDLIELRRKSRILLVVVSAVSAVLTIVLGSILLSEHQATVNVISIWPAIAVIAFLLNRMNDQVFAFDTKPPETPDPRNLKLQQMLDTAVQEEQCYLENNLTIDSLAQRLGVSAYRLRAFINQHLGYSNFSSYINQFRIAAVKKAFEDPDNQHTPILTIALNNGFNSLPPFNRAFKNLVGKTPSEYRKS